MAEVLSPPVTSPSASPHSQSPSGSSEALPSLSQQLSGSCDSRPAPRERVSSYAQSRMSQYSRSSQRSRPQSVSLEYPAFQSTLSYANVRDFAYPTFHPLHYGAPLDPSGTTTPGSEWNPGRRQSDPMEQLLGGGWSAGPWGGDGVMYENPEQEGEGGLDSLPSTAFARESEPPLDFSADEEMAFRKGKHRKSKSYASISDYERGRRRESGRRGVEVGSDGMFYFTGQQTDPAGRDSLRMSRGYGGGADSTGARKDSHLTSSTSDRSTPDSNQLSNQEGDMDPDDPIPLDSEPYTTTSPVRNSMGPEDEELFAGPSLALYSFEPENSNELRLVEGQEIMVSYRHGQGWLVASDPRTGEQGLVPEAYVRLIRDMPNYDPETGEFVDVDDGELEGELQAADRRADDMDDLAIGSGLGNQNGTEAVKEELADRDESEEDESSPIEMAVRKAKPKDDVS